MHAAAFGYVARTILSLPPRRFVVELGSCDVNGSARGLFTGSTYLGVDIAEGPGVDVVADAATFQPPFQPDTVLCLEVLEHAENAAEIIANAYRMLAPGGVFIMTCASDGRAPHSAVDGTPLEKIRSKYQTPTSCMYRPVAGGDAEFYRNVSPALATEWLRCFGEVWETPNSFPFDYDPAVGDLRVALRKQPVDPSQRLGRELRDLGEGERTE